MMGSLLHCMRGCGPSLQIRTVQGMSGDRAKPEITPTHKPTLMTQSHHAQTTVAFTHPGCGEFTEGLLSQEQMTAGTAPINPQRYRKEMRGAVSNRFSNISK